MAADDVLNKGANHLRVLYRENQSRLCAVRLSDHFLPGEAPVDERRSNEDVKPEPGQVNDSANLINRLSV
jgi:hypothetical protein